MFRKWLNDLRRDRRDAQRYHRLCIMMQDAHRWLSDPQFAQAVATIEWLQQGDAWHFDEILLKRESTPMWSQNISCFRDELRALGSVSDRESE